MSRLISSVAVCCFLASAGFTAEDKESFDIKKLMKGEVPAYTVRKGHPRIFITPDNKRMIIERIVKSPEARRAFQTVVAHADGGMRTDFRKVRKRPRRGGFGWWGSYAEAYGAIHQLGKVPGIRYGRPLGAYGKKGVQVMMHYAEQEGYHEGSGHYYTRSTGFACGYDWLQDLMTPEQRRKCVQKLISNTKMWPATERGGHAYNCPRGEEILNPLAFYGDGIEDSKAEELIEAIIKKTWWGPEGALTRLEYLTGSGVPSEGQSYLTRYQWFVPAPEAWYSAAGQDFWRAGDFWHKMVKWVIHNALPYNLNTGQRFALNRIQNYCGFYGGIGLREAHQNILALATGYLDRMGENEYASAAQWAARVGGGTRHYFLYGVLMGNPLVPAKSPWELGIPTFYLTGDNPGQVLMRSSWQDPDACVATFSCMKWDTTRTATAGMNTFTIWDNGGPLVMNRAGYRHDYQPKEETFNMVTMYPPGDKPKFRPVRGQTDKRKRHVSAFPESKIAGGLRGAHVVPGKYGYAAGDQSPVYRYFTKGVVKSFDRQLVWFQAPKKTDSDFFFLLDRVMTSGKELEPHVVLNMAFKPKVSVDFGAEAKPKKIFDWHDLFIDAPCVTITTDYAWQGWKHRAHARAFVRALLPKKVKIHRVGGEGTAYGRTLAGAVGTRKNTVGPHHAKSGDAAVFQGWYRVQVLNQQMTPKNLFLHAIEATDSKREKPSAMALLEGRGLLGARAGDCIAVFNPEYARIRSGRLTLPRNLSGTFRLLAADLEPDASYALSAGRKPMRLKSTEAGNIYVERVRLSGGESLSISRR